MLGQPLTAVVLILLHSAAAPAPPAEAAPQRDFLGRGRRR